jgi:hypothetical protein
MSAQDDLKIFLNIMAQSPNGLADPQLIGKFSRAKAQLHAMSSMADIQAMNNAPQMPPQAPQSTISPESGQSVAQPPQEPLGQNTGIPPQEPTM